MIEIKSASVKKDNKKKGDKTVKKDASTKDILQNVKSKPNYLPRFLKNEIFFSILKEINNFLINERENIVKDTEDMTEQDAIQYISKVVMQYLKTEKTDLMNVLTKFDKKISTYASVIYLLQYTNKYVKAIYEAVSGTGGSRNIKFIIDFLDLSMSKTYLHTIERIKTMLNSIGYTLINPKTQNEFDLLPGYPANRRITIQCPNKHKYSTTPNYIKNLMLKLDFQR